MDVLAEFVRMLRRLKRDESGVAMMLTLAVVLVLYVLCSGVYAVGETIREKIEMQNACDSAAYSAAVVQADGLSRMAMVNRALSWTYVSLTNTQLDYITYRFLKLVAKRFGEDLKECKDWADGSESFCFSNCGNCKNWFKAAGQGWYCGTTGIGGSGHGKVSLNGRSTSVDEINQRLNEAAGMDSQYAEMIDHFKESIISLNLLLPVINDAMQKSILNTLNIVLEANLPYANDGNPDDTIRKEYLWWHGNTGSGIAPYPVTQDKSYFSPLFNTEKDERVFLSMADGDVHPDMLSYFKTSSEEMPGGLDQWFVRSYAEETGRDAKNIEPTDKSVKNAGICRVYKNTNRWGTLKHENAMRAHHTAAYALLGDSPPSCNNTHEYNAEQCKTIDDSIALYADYGWRSTRHYCVCWTTWSPWTGIRYHHRQLNTPLHLTGRCGKHHSHSGVSCSGHSRSDYGTKSCFLNTLNYASHDAAYLMLVSANCSTTEDMLKYVLPNFGYARIYGDDTEICNTNYYAGAIAEPWVLNDSFFSDAGSIVVGLARKQRNPWQRLIGNVLSDSESAMTNGIYSAFRPTADNSHLVAFSAARAAYHYHPSRMAQDSPYNVKERDRREYETRYDAVCDNVNVVPGLGNDVGCVCDSASGASAHNSHRYARCWNLCETDWDATLLPARFALVGSSDGAGRHYDSFRGKSGISWFDALAADQNVFSASLHGEWMPFYSGDGARWITLGENAYVDNGKTGEFLYMRQPNVIEDVNGGVNELREMEWHEAPEWTPRRRNDGWFLHSDQTDAADAAFRRRIL